MSKMKDHMFGCFLRTRVPNRRLYAMMRNRVELFSLKLYGHSSLPAETLFVRWFRSWKFHIDNGTLPLIHWRSKYVKRSSNEVDDIARIRLNCRSTSGSGIRLNTISCLHCSRIAAVFAWSTPNPKLRILRWTLRVKWNRQLECVAVGNLKARKSIQETLFSQQQTVRTYFLSNHWYQCCLKVGHDTFRLELFANGRCFSFQSLKQFYVRCCTPIWHQAERNWQTCSRENRFLFKHSAKYRLITLAVKLNVYQKYLFKATGAVPNVPSTNITSLSNSSWSCWAVAYTMTRSFPRFKKKSIKRNCFWDSVSW